MPVRRRPTEPQELQTYGVRVAFPSQLGYDSTAFAGRFPIDRGCPTRLQLFRRISDVLVPGWFEWHEWTESLVRAMCENQWVGFAGAAGSAKTRNVAGFACTWWMAAPGMSSVIFCSTSLKSLRKRGWAEVQNYHTSMAGARFGNFVDSQMKWQSQKGDDKHAIIGIAVEEGSTAKVADNIKGIHTKRQLVVIDEATAVPQAIFEACTNLYSYPQEFILVLLGNPRSRLDEHGKFCEPLNGWSSVNVETEEWETKPQLNGKNGIVVRFDAEKSPNIKEGRLISRHLPTKEKVEARRKAIGGEDNPSYWSNDRGFWAPEGLTKTVFTETMLTSNDGYGKHVFTGARFQIVGAFDHARNGGDRPALRFAKIGEISGGEWGIEWMPPIIIPISAKSTKPIDYQLAELVSRQCESFTYKGEKYSCPPENLGVDETGAGAGFCDTLQMTWSAKIIRIQFGGKPSEDACSKEDVRPACEVYRNKRAEMYHRTKSALQSKQLKGVDKDTAIELCALTFDDTKPLIQMIRKEDYKLVYGKSPDLADTGVMITEVARQRGFRLAAMGQTVNRAQEWNQVVAQTQEVFESVDYTPEQDYEETFV